MHFLCANPARNNLHWLLAGAITPDIAEVISASDHHPVPAKQQLV